MNIVRQLFFHFVVAGAGAIAGSAFATDMPVKARGPVYIPPPISWSGCYAGGQVGGAQSNTDWHYNGLNPYNSLNEG